jgi:hypothetical protein
MWVFLFILAIVPMAYFWSDSVTDVFPSLQTFLPAKSHTAPAHAHGVSVLGATGAGSLGASGATGASSASDAAAAPAVSGWAERQTSSGFVAWTQSTDGAYRLAAGCHPNEAAALQFSTVSGQPVPATLSLRYPYGMQTLQDGFYRGNDTIGTVAQLKTVTVTDAAGNVLTNFNLDGVRSGLIARALQANCAESDASAAQ